MKYLLSLLVLCFAHGALAATALPVTVTTGKGAVPLTLELVTTPDTRTHGLMDRTTLKPNDGMLFVFPQTARLAFWMKNTRIPLDMLFIDEGGTILHIAASATPLSETPIDSTGPVRSVIELNGGRAAKSGIHEGDHVSYTLPAGTHVE